jgi:PAS domain S-box-containing protein
MKEITGIEIGEAVQILEDIEDGIFMVDRNRRVIYWNEGASRITGYPGVTMLNTYCYDNLLDVVSESGDSICQSACPLNHALNSGEPYRCRIWAKHATGSRIPLAVVTFPLRDSEGKIIGAGEVFRNIATEIDAELTHKQLLNTLKLFTSYYFFNELMERKTKFGEPIGFAPRRAKLTILFYDLGGFITLADKLPSETMFWFLNLLHSKAQMLALKHGGIVEKYLGESALLLFNQGQAAVEFALELLDREFPLLYDESKKKNIGELNLKVTINAGVVLMGLIQGSIHAETTVIGEVINIARRMLRAQPTRDLMITANVRNQLLRPELFSLAVNPDPMLELPQLFARSLP